MAEVDLTQADGSSAPAERSLYAQGYEIPTIQGRLPLAHFLYLTRVEGFGIKVPDGITVPGQGKMFENGPPEEEWVMIDPLPPAETKPGE